MHSYPGHKAHVGGETADTEHAVCTVRGITHVLPAHKLSLSRKRHAAHRTFQWSRIAPRPPLLPTRTIGTAARPPPCALHGADRLVPSPAAGSAAPHSARYTRLWPARLTWCSARKVGLLTFGDHVWNGVNHGRAPPRPLSRPGHGRVHSVEPFEARNRHWPIFKSSGSARLGPCGSVSPKRGQVPACAA